MLTFVKAPFSTLDLTTLCVEVHVHETLTFQKFNINLNSQGPSKDAFSDGLDLITAGPKICDIIY